MSKKILQVTLFILSLIPLVFGVLNTFMGPGRFLSKEHIIPALDSQWRFQSIYYFSMAIIIWWMIPKVERHTVPFKIIVLAVFAGGLMRLYSYFTIGQPPTTMFYAMILELCTPLLILWQHKLNRSTRES